MEFWANFFLAIAFQLYSTVERKNLARNSIVLGYSAETELPEK